MNLNTICNKNSSIEETVTSSPPSLPSSQRKLLPAINTMATSLNNTNSTHSAAATTTTSDASNSLQKTTTVTASTNKLINHHQEECLPSPPISEPTNEALSLPSLTHLLISSSPPPRSSSTLSQKPPSSPQQPQPRSQSQELPSESYNQYHHQNHQQSRQPYQAYQHQQQQQIQSKTPSLPHNTSSQHQPHLLEQQPLNYDSNYYLNSAGQSIFKLGKIAQFAAQNREARINYDHRSNSNNSIPVDENHLTFMINRTIDILNILNGLKSDELMRKQKAIITDGNASQSSRLKYRKRNKRAAPPGRCHSCDISETPEWRRGPDGARTLCNACGLH
ncbi:10334_t:CDS:2 [Entrophospora sp. SA101]|nr:10334_t:CDS:2 [Entrophospora sp. SA101]